MSWVSPAVLGATMLLTVAAARSLSVRRAVKAVRGQPPRPVNAQGVAIGAEPLRLDGSGDRGVLILHGFNDTPQSVSLLAHALHERGWSVAVPLLPHHGRGGDELAKHGAASEWISHARGEWDALCTRAPQAVLSGQSMGGAISVILAAERPPAALVLLAPYLSMGRLTRTLATLWPLWQLVTPRLLSDTGRGIRDSTARAKALGNRWFTPRLVAELKSVVRQARRSLTSVRVPALVLHARTDYRIPSSSAARAYAEFASADKTLIWRDDTGHVLAADRGADEVAALVGDWLEERVPPPNQRVRPAIREK